MRKHTEKKTAAPEAETDRVRVGRIKVHPDGFAFFSSEDEALDVYIASRARGGALDGDRVEVEWWTGPRGLDGRVLRVLERARDRITGQIEGRGRQARFVPDDPRIVEQVTLLGGLRGASEGQAVLATITRYPASEGDSLEVQIDRVLGDPNDPRTEVEKILATAGVKDEFDSTVARMATAMPTEVHSSDHRDRADLRNIPFCTIDPETARDFDDAVALEPLPRGGHRLWVAVADVSHYVREDSPIDREARRRGCSIYLPNRAIPMLPEQLSAHICSLVPEQDRLAMVARIDFDAHAKPLESEFYAAVIHSRARLDYPGVAAALAGKLGAKRKLYEPFLPDLQKMQAFAERLREQRMQRGALNLDLPEAVIELDQDDPGRIRDVRRSRKDPGEKTAYSMIEEFMLAANEAVARSFSEHREDTVWRIHDVPDRTKLETFAGLAERNGIAVDIDELTRPAGLRELLAELEGHAAERALSFQLLRSLKQASYDVVNVGHFGLAAPFYVHFTSPIRRYPDLIVHRLLKGRLAALHKPAGGFPSNRKVAPPPVDELAKMATASSRTERRAQEIEREAVDVYRTFFMRDRIGHVYQGTISGVTSFGVFVSLDDPFVEGLIRIEDLPPDEYVFDERGLRLVGRRGGLVLGLGDVVSAEIIDVSVQRRKIDMRLHEHVAGGEQESGGRKRGARPRKDGHRKGGRTDAGRSRERAKGEPRRGERGTSRSGPREPGRGPRAGKHPGGRGRPGKKRSGGRGTRR